MIKYLTIRNFVAPMNEGTVNHDSGDNWTMQDNTIINNGGAGIFLGAGNVASYNCLKDNSQYGFQAYGARGGESNMVLDHNDITGNNTGNLGIQERRLWRHRRRQVLGRPQRTRHEQRRPTRRPIPLAATAPWSSRRSQSCRPATRQISPVAVLLGLPLEDSERQGVSQQLQDEPSQLLQLLDEHVWRQCDLLQLRHVPVMVALQS